MMGQFRVFPNLYSVIICDLFITFSSYLDVLCSQSVVYQDFNLSYGNLIKSEFEIHNLIQLQYQDFLEDDSIEITVLIAFAHQMWCVICSVFVPSFVN